MHQDQLEIEVKFFIDQPDAIHSRLIKIGAKAFPRVFESNLCLDTPEQAIYNNGGLLRLRKDTTNRLTLKCKPEKTDPDVKTYRELEIEISEFKTMQQIFEYLGFYPAKRYEKWRQVYQLDEATCFVDTLPFGSFLEIEGRKDTIRKAAEILGLEWGQRIIKNYLSIFNILKEKEGFGFTDPTFENFKDITATIQPYLNDIVFTCSDSKKGSS